MTAALAPPRRSGPTLAARARALPPAVPAAGLAFALYLWPALSVVQLSPDAVEYVDVARRLLAGEGYVLGVKAYHFGGTEVLHDGLAERPPLFVGLVALVLGLGLGLHAVQVVNAFLAALCVGLVAAIGDRLFGRRVGLAAGMLAALSPVVPARLVPPMTEATALFLALLATWLVLVGAGPPASGRPLGGRSSSLAPFVAAGAALGLGYLTRPTLAVLVPALALGTLLVARGRGAALRSVGALLGTAALLAAPITLYSLVTRGTPSYSGQSYLYAVFKDADVLRNGYGRELPTPLRFVTENWQFVLVAVLENARDYLVLLFADRAWLWPLLPAVPFVLLAIARGRYGREAIVVLLAAAANFAVYAATWANYQERYQALTLLLLLPFLADGLDRAVGWLGGLASRAAPRPVVPPGHGGGGPWRGLALGVLVAAVGATWLPRVAEAYRGEFRYGDEPTRARVDGGLRWTGPPRWVSDPDLARVVDWIEDRTAPRDVLAHREPWPFTFFTSRPATLLPTKLAPERLRAFLTEYRVAYVLLDTGDRDRRGYADDLEGWSGEGVRVAATVGRHRVFDTRALWGGR